jgi:hypothetical protein
VRVGFDEQARARALGDEGGPTAALTPVRYRAGIITPAHPHLALTGVLLRLNSPPSDAAGTIRARTT